MSSLPKNWPANIVYLTTPAYSATLKESHVSSLRTTPKGCQDLHINTPKGPCPLVKITQIFSELHPAHGQCGLLATRDLKPGTFILQYLGEIHISPRSSSSHDPASSIDSHAHSNYDLSLDRELGIGIDADKEGNEARFINDYRGIAERPNAEFREIWDDRRNQRGIGVWVLPSGKNRKWKGVRKGEEILVSYGKGFWGARK